MKNQKERGMQKFLGLCSPNAEKQSKVSTLFQKLTQRIANQLMFNPIDHYSYELY